MEVCVFHPKYCGAIADALERRFPDLTVRRVTDISTEPDCKETSNVLIAFRFPKGLLGHMPRLTWVQLTSAGYEHVLAEPGQARLTLSNAATVPAVSVAEFAMMAVLAFAKRAPQLIEQQRERQWKVPPAERVEGSTMVLLGLGHIGQAIARRASAFGAHVIGVRRTAASAEGVERVVQLEQLPEVLPRADWVVNALPESASTRRALGREQLARLKPTAALISVGRSSVIDVDALVERLRAGQLKGALLDTHDVEPLPPDSPLWSVPGLWVTPHSAFQHSEEADELAALCVENVRRYRSHEPLLNLIHPAQEHTP